jgi:chromosomal replication initiator protein
VAFRNKYRKADVLLIDDIQFIAGKESTQEEFFHTFNALYEEHKQIILVADRPPKDMKTLEDRLRSRFEGGLIVDVQPPDYELRLAILKNKAKLIGVDIPLPILQYLADCLRSNIRQIEGVVKKIAAQSFLTGMPVSKEIAERCVAEIDEGGLTEGEMVERIIAKIASNYRMSPEDLKGRKKSKEIANARHICIYIIRNMTEMSLPSIGNIFGRDHSTILNSIDVIEKRMKQSPMLDLEIRDLMKEIREA